MNRVDRPFKVIAFDWDGTAVMSREEDASAVRHCIEQLLGLGVRIVVITGTNFPNVHRQASSLIVSPHKHCFFACTNRGSEVFSFDEHGAPRLLLRRTATAEEDRELDEIAERVRSWMESRGVAVDIIANRLNRRKIDLIPLPEWRDPPKSMIADLLGAVDRRLKEGGIVGGVKEVIDKTADIAREVGMRLARITSDVKHVEVGLTDKGDSVDWMMSEVVANGGLTASDVLIAGDEFGPIDGFPGSDYRMVRPSAEGSLYVSVGKEPKGAPPEVVHLGGGPERFRRLLEGQIALHEGMAGARTNGGERLAMEAKPRLLRPRGPEPAPTNGTGGWQMVESGFNPAREHEIESVYSIGNGYLGVRASLSEGSATSRPGTFIAGMFTLPARPNAVPEFVKPPSWLALLVRVDGEELRLDSGEMLEHARTLDLKRGVLDREWRHRDGVGRITRLRFIRFVSLADRHALVESVSIVPENYGGYVTVEGTLDGKGAGSEGQYSVPSTVGEQVLAMRVPDTGAEVAFSMASTLRPDAGPDGSLSIEHTRDQLIHRWEWPAELGKEYHVDKLVSVYTTNDVSDPVATAAKHAASLRQEGMAALLAAHERAWEERWREADVLLEGDERSQLAIRFAIYHLISAANPEDARVSIGARGLTGEAYKGHVFWDTETFMLPFFTFTDPESARTLLLYRHRTLPAARERAKEMGYRGALYAWESTNTGKDVTPRQVITPEGEVIKILSGVMEHHISADVAYAVWQYWQATGDDHFLVESGAEILLETARFWASRSTSGRDGLYHILHVIGPDEYHEDVNDNAFTNVMAQWNLERGVEIAQRFEARWPRHWDELTLRLGLDQAEIDQWRAIAGALYTGFDSATGLYEQFEGFHDLEHIDLRPYRPRTAPLDVILGRPRIHGSQIIKQADVVMLLHLLWDRFRPRVREVNFRHYESRTDHGSSLSPATHALVAARLGDMKMATRYFKQSAEIDLANNMGNAASGVHMAAQGALWQAVTFGFAGMTLREDGLSFDPHLPPNWHALRFAVRWQGRRVHFHSARHPMRFEVALESGEPMVVSHGTRDARRLEPGGERALGRWQLPERAEEVA